MATQLKYLDDTSVTKDAATVAGIATDESGTYITLAATIFHPQGGGQPTDKGEIVGQDGKVGVTMARYVDEEVRHYCVPNAVPFKVGESVTLEVDEAVRMQNAKCHSAGHLLQSVVEKYCPELRAVKGFHFSHGPYVQFKGPKPPDSQEFLSEVNSRLASAIEADRPYHAEMVEVARIAEVCPDLLYDLPPDRPLRIVTITGMSAHVPCGGTHVHSTAQLGRVAATKVKAKKGDVKVSYTVG